MKTNPTPQAIEQRLQKIAQGKQSIFQADNLRQAIAIEALSRSDIKDFFLNLLIGGCKCGMIPELKSLDDTNAFFHQFANELDAEDSNFELQEYSPLEILKESAVFKNEFACHMFDQAGKELALELNVFV